MNKKIKVTKTRDKIKTASIVAALAAVFYFSTRFLGISLGNLGRLRNAGNVLSKFLVVDFSNISKILDGMLTSAAMAISALAIGGVISLILAFLAASNTAPNKALSTFLKSLFAIIRAVPALVWVLMVVASLGFGNTGGVIGIVFPTTGYLFKSFTSSIESQGYDVIEAMKTTGAHWLNIMLKGLFPCLRRPFISWISIRLEANMAESIGMGMVGAGGIGTLLTRALGQYDFASISMIVIVIFATLFIVELLVTKLRKSI
jgi:phosphonate transport system permease protein